MGLQILALEDRIVFDAVGAPDADPNHQADDVAVAFEPAVEPAPAIDAHDAAEADNATDAAVEADADQEAEHAPLDHGGDVGASTQDGVRVLVVSSAIDDAVVLAEAARDNVITVTYDAETADLDTILTDIQDALAGEKADSIAFAVHGTEAGNFILARNQVVSLANLLENRDQQEFWQELSQSITGNGRIDIMACNLTASDTGQGLVTELESLTNRNVAASDDMTGNAAAGGDWILEAGNIDLAATYFDGDRLAEFSGTLPGWGPVTDFLDDDSANVANYASGGTALLDVGSDFKIVDLDSAGWDGGYLNVYISWHGNAGDELYFNDFGAYAVVGGGTSLERGGTAIAAITGWQSDNLKLTWNSNATTADVQNVVRAIRFDPDNGGNKDTRDFQFEFRNAADNSAWDWCQATIDGPVLGNHALNGYADGSITVLNATHLSAADADAAGNVNIQFQLDEAAHNGSLQLSGTTLSSGDTFTMDDILNSRVRYVHTSGSPLFDAVDFRIKDTTNSQLSGEYRLYFNGTGDSSPIVDLDVWSAGNNRTKFMPYNVEMEELAWGNGDALRIVDDTFTVKTITINLTNNPDGANEWIDLESWDRDRASGLYGITVTGGGGTSLTLSSGSAIDGDNFAEILSRVRYYHGAIGRTAGVRNIEIVVNDGTGNNSNTAHWYIDVEPDSGKPVVTDHFMQVHRGTTRVISGGNLKTLDSNTPASGLTYTIQSITWDGNLLLNGSALGTGSSFTQAQVDAGQLSYQHTGGGSGWGWDNFNFKVSDGTNDTWGWMDLEIVPIDQPLWDQPGGDGFAPGDMADMGEGFGDDGGFFGEMGVTFDTVQEAAQSLSQSLDRDQLDQDVIDADDADNAMDMATRAVNDGWDTVLDAFGRDSEASSILGNAITEIRRAKVLYGQSDSTLGQAQSLLELYQGPVREFLKELVQGMDDTTANMNSAKNDLTALLHAAIGAGNRFDKAYGDAILSQVSSLTVDNDQVFIQESVLQSVVAQINEQGGDLNLERLRKIAAQAEKQAEQKIMVMHNLKDKAARDKVAASIDKLLNKQKITEPGKNGDSPTPKDQPAPTPEPGPVGDAGSGHDPEGDPSLQRNNIFAEAGALLSAMSFAGRTTTDTNTNSHNQHSLESATAILENTKAMVSKDLLSSLIHATRISRN